MSVEEIADADLASAAPESFQQEMGDGLTLETLLGTESPEESLIEQLSLRAAIDLLPERERMTILLRFFKALTQEQTARVLGVSQVQVSRLERRALQKLRTAMETEDSVRIGLKLRQKRPEALRHVRHAELRIFPFADGDGIVKAAPEPAIALFRLVGRSHDELLQRYDGRMTVGIKSASRCVRS